jgi:hypothetical protein
VFCCVLLLRSLLFIDVLVISLFALLLLHNGTHCIATANSVKAASNKQSASGKQQQKQHGNQTAALTTADRKSIAHELEHSGREKITQKTTHRKHSVKGRAAHC